MERVAEVSFNCAPEVNLKTSAAEHVRQGAVLGGKELEIGDGGYLKRQNVKFAQAGCVVTVQRLRSMDLREGVTGEELDRALVALAERTSVALGAP